MKYLKTHEDIYDEKIHFMCDYDNIDNVSKDIDWLKKYNIPYNLYYYVYGDKLYFKIHNYVKLSKFKCGILGKRKNFYLTTDEYYFTWDWKKIKDEDLENPELLMYTNNYNI